MSDLVKKIAQIRTCLPSLQLHAFNDLSENNEFSIKPRCFGGANKKLPKSSQNCQTPPKYQIWSKNRQKLQNMYLLFMQDVFAVQIKNNPKVAKTAKTHQNTRFCQKIAKKPK